MSKKNKLFSIQDIPLIPSLVDVVFGYLGNYMNVFAEELILLETTQKNCEEWIEIMREEMCIDEC